MPRRPSTQRRRPTPPRAPVPRISRPVAQRPQTKRKLPPQRHR